MEGGGGYTEITFSPVVLISGRFGTKFDRSGGRELTRGDRGKEQRRGWGCR